MAVVSKYEDNMRKRLLVVFYASVAFFLLLGGRLVYLQEIKKDWLCDIAQRQHKGRIEIPALRGSILDRNGSELATSMALPSIAANTTQIDDIQKTAATLAAILGKEKKRYLSLLSRRTTFVWIARKCDTRRADAIMKKKLPGIFPIMEPSGKRFYPKGKLACHILGYTGIDDQGLEGTEAFYDGLLKGKPGHLDAELDREGRVIPYGRNILKAAQPGYNLVLTVDESLQYIAERELDKAVTAHKARSGSVIIMDVRTGDILAMANKPDFKVEDFGKTEPGARRNRAVSDCYEPGSTFKVFLAAGALDSGKISDEQRFYCGSSIQVGGWSIRNANDGLCSRTGSENTMEIIVSSYNVGAASVGLKIGRKTLHKYLDAFGFGRPTGIDLAGEQQGILHKPEMWSEVTTATISFGQGVSVTPLQLVTAMSAIANKGVMMRPRIVRALRDSKGNVVKTYLPVEAGKPISPKTALKMREILLQVAERGTGKKAKVPGYLIAGKTGTANVCEGGRYISGKYIASFLGFAPQEDPRIAILAKIDIPQGTIWGGVVAAPVFSEVAREALYHLGISPTLPITQEETFTTGKNN
jgi:stage V sporulation protein D (sporulation-specific penicillin-binding protein)